LDANITQEILDGIKDSVMQEMNSTLMNVQDTTEDLMINMHRLELLFHSLQNNISENIAPDNETSTLTATSEVFSQIQLLQSSLDEHAKSVADVEQKISNVEALLDGQNQIMMKLNEDVRRLKHTTECSGTTIAESCYFVIHQKVDYQLAVAECAKNHAVLASITSQDLYDELYNQYIIDEEIMTDRSSVFLWLGSSYSNETNNVIDGEGEVINFSNWLPGWPRNLNSSDNRMTWLVLRDPNITYHGMLNSHPMTISYPLCRKPNRVQVEGHCLALVPPENGSIQYVGSSNHTSMNSVAVVMCDNGFTLSENDAYVLICTESGSWSSPMPSCISSTTTGPSEEDEDN